jgi:hypothetical protein
MTDVRTRLRRASGLVDVPERSYERLVERRDRGRRRQRLATFTVALVVAAGSLGAVAVLLSRLDRAVTGVGSDWEPSRRLELRPGEYLYLHITSDEAEDGQIRDMETWWATDGSGEVRNRSTRQDKYPYPPSGVYRVGTFPTWRSGVSSLSTDPSRLAAQLREDPSAGAGGPEAERLWDAISFLMLETPYASPELRAASFQVASDLDGVDVNADGVDPVGRHAIEVSFENVEDGATWTMYFDHGTHQAMAWVYRSTRGGSAWQLIESGIVGEPGARPTAEQRLVPPIP